MPPSFAVGIDLGTTCSAISLVDDIGRSTMARNPQGDLLIPSIVYFEDDELVFGNAARHAASMEPSRAAECVKRDLGQAAYSRAINGELLPAEVIEACLLKRLTDDLAAANRGRPAVVLAVPACFDQGQRRALLDAGQIAGIDLLGTIDESLAAALSFAENQGYIQPPTGDKPGCRALIFDLGGGKLDVAIVEIKPRRVRTLAVGGEPRLGGRDWDARLADTMAAEFAKQFGEDPRYDMISVRRLLQTAEETKQTLTARSQARVRIERSSNSADITVTRQAFEEATADLVDRGRRVAEQALTHAGLAWRDLSHVLLVGGATRMPMIGKMLETLTGLKPILNIHPEEAVARGAALLAEKRLAEREARPSKVQVEITNMTCHSLGVEWIDPETKHGENIVLIRRGTELPCTTTSTVAIEQPDQTSITLQLLEGESRDADECSRIAEVVIRDLPVGLPKGWRANMQYQFTAEGRLQVKATIPNTGELLRFEVLRERGLSEEQLDDWKNLLAGPEGLKPIHAYVAEHKQNHEQGPIEVPAPGPDIWQKPQPPPPLGRRPPPLEHVQVNVDPGSMDRAQRKRQDPSQKMLVNLINAAGFLLFSLLGLAIGYYILLILRPEWNVYHLWLPGLG